MYELKVEPGFWDAFVSITSFITLGIILLVLFGTFFKAYAFGDASYAFKPFARRTEHDIPEYGLSAVMTIALSIGIWFVIGTIFTGIERNSVREENFVGVQETYGVIFPKTDRGENITLPERNAFVIIDGVALSNGDIAERVQIKNVDNAITLFLPKSDGSTEFVELEPSN